MRPALDAGGDPKGSSLIGEVTRLIVTEDDKHFNKLSIATGEGIETLTATHEHPFWSPSAHRWVEADDLKPAMTLRTDTGTTVIVTANRAFTKHAQTYNLTVDDLHTYYVLAGETPVLVHNSNGACGVAGIPNLHGKNLADAEQDIFGKGFKFKSETEGGYRRYDHSDGSQVWIRPNGEVQRLGPTIDPGPNQKNYRPRYGPDGQPTQQHSTGEVIER